MATSSAVPAAMAKRVATKPALTDEPSVAPAVAGGPVKTEGDRLAIMAVQSDAARRVANWVVAAKDNGGRPYAVIDKPTASLLLFNGKGVLVGQAPVLLGIGVGDDSTPGVGGKELADIGPAERTTPAGRYVAKFGRAFGKQRVLWVDYANSVALHAVITTHKQERRVERLLSPTPDDNRISAGCINIGTRFYADQLSPMFRKSGGMVYITPDTRSLDDVFPRVRLLQYLSQARDR
ncbi:hypothetical protein ACT009_13705 [Sphingomonas sp. Tas61C01]|uniref:hypothetical protein n=1 Tax=Sphingomonas sp. Tas61C01 TaxID=3458297 RepID=UPI00403E5D96